MTLIARFDDKVVPPGKGVFLEYTIPHKCKITHYVHYVSSDGWTALYRGVDKVFPSEGEINIVGVFIIFELPEPIECDAGDKLYIRYENKTSGNIRIIGGFMGKEE